MTSLAFVFNWVLQVFDLALGYKSVPHPEEQQRPVHIEHQQPAEQHLVDPLGRSVLVHVPLAVHGALPDDFVGKCVNPEVDPAVENKQVINEHHRHRHEVHEGLDGPAEAVAVVHLDHDVDAQVPLASHVGPHDQQDRDVVVQQHLEKVVLCGVE